MLLNESVKPSEMISFSVLWFHLMSGLIFPYRPAMYPFSTKVFATSRASSGGSLRQNILFFAFKEHASKSFLSLTDYREGVEHFGFKYSGF